MFDWFGWQHDIWLREPEPKELCPFDQKCEDHEYCEYLDLRSGICNFEDDLYVYGR